ncbi:MAG: hypothetical protein IKA82_01840 [Clostridia bacterium]|nr:hypothetical protein [Clostridia bacterium]
MFECQWKTDRRSTNYIMEQAMEWVKDHIVDFKNIMMNISTPEAERCKKDIETIFSSNHIDSDQYERIYQCMNIDWLEKMLMGGKNVSIRVSTANMRYVFLKFPNTKDKYVPIGFIVDFFEDEYDEEKRIAELFEEYLAQQKAKICHNFKMQQSNVNAIRERVQEKKDELNVDTDSVSRCMPKLVTYIILWGITFILSIIGLVTFFTDNRLASLISSLGDLPLLLRYVPNAIGIIVGLLVSFISIGKIVKEIKLISGIKKILANCQTLENNLDIIEANGDKIVESFCDNMTKVLLYANSSASQLEPTQSLPEACFSIEGFEDVETFYETDFEHLSYFMNNITNMDAGSDSLGDIDALADAIESFDKKSISRSNKFGGKIAGKIIVFLLSLITFYPILDMIIGAIIK